MQDIQLNIIGQRIQLVKRSADELSGLNMGEKLSYDFYDGTFRDARLLFVKPKGANPTPRGKATCDCPPAASVIDP